MPRATQATEVFWEALSASLEGCLQNSPKLPIESSKQTYEVAPKTRKVTQRQLLQLQLGMKQQQLLGFFGRLALQALNYFVLDVRVRINDLISFFSGYIKKDT